MTEKFPQSVTEFEIFVTKYQDPLFRHAFYKLGNREDAEDILQDTLIRAFDQKEKLTGIRNPFLYMLKMLSNACTDRHRMKIRKSTDSLDDLPQSKAGMVIGSEEERIAREEAEHIRRLLSTLPLEQQEVIHLRIVDGLSFVQMARMLNLPVTTVKSRFTYGIDKLKVYFEKGKEMCCELP